MGDLLVHDFNIQSHKGAYSVELANLAVGDIPKLGTHYIVDRAVLDRCGQLPNLVVVDACEQAKSLQGVMPYIEQLIGYRLRRDSTLVAIGGGITQDIACFIASNYMRGLRWNFVPTTLLAQADSCIGSKSSINFGSVKNLLGSYNPPNRVIIDVNWLQTLHRRDICSGIGEIIKLLIIGNQAVDVDAIHDDLPSAIYRVLRIKQQFIEQDEFDRNIRLTLNYGHCFGHAIESTVDYAIPHGIAVSMGMRAANNLSVTVGLTTPEAGSKYNTALYDNYRDFLHVDINYDHVLDAMTMDKKNTNREINLILPIGDSIAKKGFDPTTAFWSQCRQAISDLV
jgi:3-dehydroquinate synthase